MHLAILLIVGAFSVGWLVSWSFACVWATTEKHLLQAIYKYLVYLSSLTHSEHLNTSNTRFSLCSLTSLLLSLPNPNLTQNSIVRRLV